MTTKQKWEYCQLQWLVTATDLESARAAKEVMPKLSMKTEFNVTTVTMGILTDFTTGEATHVDDPVVSVKLLGEDGWELVTALRAEIDRASVPIERKTELTDIEKQTRSTSTTYLFKRPL